MKTSEQGIALIKAHEGVRLTAYPDPAHGWAVPTIGYGHTSAAGPPTVHKGMKITQAGADEILRRDLSRFEGYVRDAVRVPLTQSQFDAQVSFTFNLGPGNLRSSTLLRKLKAGDYQGAADQFGAWNKAGGKVLPGLVKRRAAERALFLSGVPHPALPPSPSPAGPTVKPTYPPPARDPGSAIPIVLVVGAVITAVAAIKLIGG